MRSRIPTFAVALLVAVAPACVLNGTRPLPAPPPPAGQPAPAVRSIHHRGWA